MKSRRLFLMAILMSTALWMVPAHSGDAPMTDFRMAPLEQAKKIHSMMNARDDFGSTLTVMLTDPLKTEADQGHIIVGSAEETPADLDQLLDSPGVDGVSWRGPIRLHGACDTQDECEDRTDDMCDRAGHGGVREVTVRITTHLDGSRTCSGDCDSGGAVAFVSCNPAGCLACN